MFKNAITALEDVQTFLEHHGNISTSLTHIGPAIDAVVSLQVKAMNQQTLDGYFNAQESS